MTTHEKGRLIGLIVTNLQFDARQKKKLFCAGDTFLSLAFKSDDEVSQIAKLAGVLI